MTVTLTATVESLTQAKQLLESGVDYLYFGEADFALRLPTYFSRDEQEELVRLAHAAGKKVSVAVNGIMHPEKMVRVPEYLTFLVEIGVDQIVVGDTGVIHLIRRDKYDLPFIYDAQMLVTSSRQVNFWAKRGAIGAVLAREIPYLELIELSKNLMVPGEVLVYGATCIHQSKRPLLENYYNFTELKEESSKERGLFLAEPRKDETHYSIYEDQHGTHIFANNDLNLMAELEKLVEHNYNHWKLEGIYTPGVNFVEVVKVFVKARQALAKEEWSAKLAAELSAEIVALHPAERGLDTGFFLLDPDDVK